MERARKRQTCEPADKNGGIDGPCGGAGRGDNGCPGVGLVYRANVGAPVPYYERWNAPSTRPGPHPHYWTSDQREEWMLRHTAILDARQKEPLFCGPQEQKLKALDARAVLLDNIGYVDQYASERLKALIIHTRKAM